MNITREEFNNIIQEEIAAVLSEISLPKNRDSLVQAGMQIGGYLNCKLFVQELYGIAKIKELPSKPYSLEQLEIGDIIAWHNGMHYAVYLGNGEILQVEEWGSTPEIVDIEEANEEHDDPMTIYTPPLDEEISEAKYHWNEPKWHYDGGYGEPEGPNSKWYITEAELDEKKKKSKSKKNSKSKAKKAGTESSKESNLGDWFGRKGAKGKKKGWVDCNAPDGSGGYKSCGRSDGEKRKKYPACRPTPGACKEKGKGKSWGKKTKKGKKK